jgi:hypothetical protein
MTTRNDLFLLRNYGSEVRFSKLWTNYGTNAFDIEYIHFLSLVKNKQNFWDSIYYTYSIIISIV